MLNVIILIKIILIILIIINVILQNINLFNANVPHKGIIFIEKNKDVNITLLTLKLLHANFILFSIFLLFSLFKNFDPALT